MRQVLCPVLVGREDEVQVLLDGLDRAAGGHGGAFVVLGEAGVGKSRLVREVSRLAGDRGLPVLTGRAVAGGAAVPFRPLAEAVMAELRRSGRPDLEEMGSFRPALGRLVPSWLPHEPVPGAESPVVIGEGLLRLLRVVGQGRGCLLVLEDLHWADRESLSVLEYLADNLATEGVACVATLRTGEDGTGRDLVETLLARRAARAVELGRLDDEATLRLARACLSTSALPAAVEEFLGARADGLPFLIEELLAGLVVGGTLVERDGRWTTGGPLDRRVPPTFADAVARRLAALPPHARSVLHAAALLGRSFEWSLLPAATGLDDAEVVSALRQAVGAQLVTAEDAGFQFRHALTCEAVLGDLVAPERASLAARTLLALERARPELAGAWCELAADLAEVAGDPARASQLWLTAGLRAAAAGALASAEEMLRRARRLAPGEPELAVRIGVALTDVLAQAGQVDRAFELGELLLARLDPVSRDPGVRSDLHLRLARAGVAAGRWEVAEEHLAAVEGTTALVEALAAQVALGQGRLSEADRLAAAALAAAERDEQPAVACEALEVAGRVARQQDLRAAEAAFARELAVATAHGLTLWRLRALHELGTVDQQRTESVDRLRQARELAAEVGALALVATLDLQIAAGLIKQFRPVDGLGPARGSAEMSRRLRLATLPMALIMQAAAYAQLGRADDMEAGLREALALAPDDLDVQGSALGHCRATASLLAEDRTRALAEMTTGARLLQRSPATVAPPFLGLRVLLLAVAGDDTAQAEIDRVRDSGATRHRVVAILLGYAEAVLLGRAGRPAEAAAAFAAADAEMGPLVAWYRQYARRSAAEAALADDWGEPALWLREAAAYFAARGDQVVAATCRELLRRAGIPVPRPGRDDPGVPGRLRALGVTSREAEVLALLAEGLTNQEVGARLHLSPRTVEKHVAGLLAKTGCRRRAQLAGYSAGLSA
ncbi:ATP-binding protein [Actinoplanes sp. CA-142083]|uniref:ATP-binding protein n=1 Tax=Actinoplanes sp. CA-142083 TaxID=3239903 RepID=UPI003D8CAFB7